MLLFAGDSDGDIVAVTLCPALVGFLQATAAGVDALDLGPAKSAKQVLEDEAGRTEVNRRHRQGSAAFNEDSPNPCPILQHFRLHFVRTGSTLSLARGRSNTATTFLASRRRMCGARPQRWQSRARNLGMFGCGLVPNNQKLLEGKHMGHTNPISKMNAFIPAKQVIA